MPLSRESAEQLTRVELTTGSGERIARTSRFAAAEFAAALNSDDVIVIERVGAGRVSLRWDSSRFPVVMVRDVETREVLTFARGGEATLLTDGPVLEATVSDGVRSGAKLINVR